MSAESNTGSEQFWIDGLPADWLPNTNEEAPGSERFWHNGLPSSFLYLLSITAIATPVLIVFTVPSPEIVRGMLRAVSGVVSITFRVQDAYIVLPTPVIPPPFTVIPITPVLTGVYSTARTWGGKLIARPDSSDLRTDLLELVGYGFNIMGLEQRANETHIWVVGDFALADRWTNNFDTHRNTLPGWFFPLPIGELVTLSMVQEWTPYKRLLF